MIERRSPHQVGKAIATGINNGNINFFDKHLSMFPVDLMYGFYTLKKESNRLDVAIVEASAITEDGGIIPGASVGATPEIIQMADKVGACSGSRRGGDTRLSRRLMNSRSLSKSTRLRRTSRACTTSQ
jgi:Acetyl-CoA hydrolase/transferase N-terminal domain